MSIVRIYFFFILAFFTSIAGLGFTFWFSATEGENFQRFVLALYIYPTCQIISIYAGGYHWMKESPHAMLGLLLMVTTCFWSQLLISIVALFWTR